MFRRQDPDLRTLDALLDRERHALDAGDTRALAAMTAEKAELLDRLEARSGELKTRAESDAELRRRLGETREKLVLNATRLERVASTVTELAGALAKVRDRHGLAGLYGSNGAKSASAAPRQATLDREI